MPKYIVILHDALDSSQAGRAELKLRLVENLHVSKKTVEGIFESLPVIISRDLEQATAERYAETLEALGAVAEVIEQSAPLDHSVETHSTSNAGTSPVSAPQESDVDIQDLEALLEDALASEDEAAQAASAPAKLPASAAPEMPIEEEDWHLAGIELENEPAPKSKVKPLFAFEDRAPAEQAARPSILDDLIHFEAAAPASQPAGSSGSHRIPPSVPGVTEEPAPQTEAPVVSSSGSQRAFQPVESKPHAEDADIEHSVSGSFPAHRSFFKRTKHLAAASAVLFGFVILLFGKQTLYALTGQGGQRMTITFDVESLLREQANIFGSDAKDDVHVPVITGQWVGELNESGVQANIRLTELDGAIALASLRVTTEQPAPLTQQELVAGKPFPVWLRHLDAGNLPPLVGPDPFQPPGEGSALFSGTAKTYLEDAKGSGRFSVHARVLVERVPDSPDELKIQWIVSRLENPTSFEGQNSVTRTNANDFRVLFQGTLKASKEAASKTEIGAHRS